MRRLILGLTVLAAVLAVPLVSAQDRMVTEFSDGGMTLSRYANSSLSRGQTGDTALKDIQCVANVCLRAVPSGATEGIELTSVSSYVVVCELSTGTFLGTGANEIYLRDPGLAGWRYVDNVDIVPKAGATTFSTPVRLVSWRPGLARMVVRPVGVGTSAAAPVMMCSIQACLKEGCGR